MQKLLIAAAMGLGLGLSITLTIFSAPDISLAGSESSAEAENQKLTVDSISVPSIGFVSDIADESEKKLHHGRIYSKQVGTAQLGKVGTLFITSEGYFSHIPNLEIVELGDEVVLIGSNNGIYRYTITALRTVAYSEVLSLSQDTKEELVLFSKKSTLNSEAQVVIAHRVQ